MLDLVYGGRGSGFYLGRSSAESKCVAGLTGVIMAVPDRTVDLQWRGQASPLTLTLTLSTGIGLQLICFPFSLVILSRSTVAVALHGVTVYDELVYIYIMWSERSWPSRPTVASGDLQHWAAYNPTVLELSDD